MAAMASPTFAPASRPTLAELPDDAPVLCSTHRLARSLRLAHDRARMARGLARWQPLPAQTLAQWLDGLIEEALLAGAIPAAAAPIRPLTALQERIVWERAITSGDEGDPLSDPLFDREGLAEAAAEANALCETWKISVGGAAQTEEGRSFLRWREEFRRVCSDAGWFEPARHLAWQIERIAAGAGRLPRELAFAGFDRFNPQELRLIGVLQARGVRVAELDLGRTGEPAAAFIHAAPDREAECRAAAGWARQRLAENPGARLGIVVPELQTLRQRLAAILDDALDPEAASPGQAERPRRYNFSLGLPLAGQPIVAAALDLLELAAHPRRIALQAFGALLNQPHWSAAISEADGRARLEARLRQRLPPTVSLARLLRCVQRHEDRSVSRLVGDLAAFQAALAAQPARQVPSAWAAAFADLLAAAAWPGERPLSSHEFQAQRAFHEALADLAGLDAVHGRVSMAEASRRLKQLARERIFQPETENQPQLEVMGLLEAVGTPLDGLWVMGMNDHLWPPPARPNPLLPARLQRDARAPNASAEVQGEFARAVHRRLLRSAAELRFSWARTEGDRELRPSPLLADASLSTPAAADDHFGSRSLLETLASSAKLELLEDHQAPQLAPGEAVRGGTSLLRAQALCPAWAFYRYRLGARALELPVEGLDAAERGTLVHAVLQNFWRGRGSRALQDMDEAVRRQQVAEAVALGLQAFNAQREEELSPNFLALEAERLRRLLDAWLEVEAQRLLPFRVVACEQSSEVQIAGIDVRLVVDRIDELEDGRRVILDYKTGSEVSAASWGEERIAEPQLPVYALTSERPPAAVALARVRQEEPGFVGIAAESGLLPGLAGIGDDAARKLFPEVVGWEELLALWRVRIEAIAREIAAGCAAVSFEREQDLEYCEVRPLLRLAERRAQLEAGEGA
ncbi:PD-(D/E)XK nuclease superfamily protein [mine drainage metagenome]|uniref:PD-(D/E)XK nuclease superfamily protein n=1 Tax=mine drainage metagenome TaxID=410659 RepID=A0A1J5SGN1_9ZZZZ